MRLRAKAATYIWHTIVCMCCRMLCNHDEVIKSALGACDEQAWTVTVVYTWDNFLDRSSDGEIGAVIARGGSMLLPVAGSVACRPHKCSQASYSTDKTVLQGIWLHS